MAVIFFPSLALSDAFKISSRMFFWARHKSEFLQLIVIKKYELLKCLILSNACLSCLI